MNFDSAFTKLNQRQKDIYLGSAVTITKQPRFDVEQSNPFVSYFCYGHVNKEVRIVHRLYPNAKKSDYVDIITRH